MKRPIAQPTRPAGPSSADDAIRAPRAFTPAKVETIEGPIFDAPDPETDLTLPVSKPRKGMTRLAWTAGGILVSLGLGLAAERLIRDLFERYPWLGWVGVAALVAFVLAIIAIAAREMLALRRLLRLDRLREKAAAVLLSDRTDTAKGVLLELETIYAGRADMARARLSLLEQSKHQFDGAEMIDLAERLLMVPLDARAKGLVAASARRVALVTTVSPRALVDIAFVAYESIRLAGAIAALYGARPGFFGFWRLAGAVLSHLAITGGLAMTDGLMEQLVGQGLAAKLSARLGEGVVNGLMTVRVGIAAMRVVRPLPFHTQSQPLVKDFLADLANVAKPANP